MTPTQHASQAESILARISSVGPDQPDAATSAELLQVAAVHAALAAAAGTGQHYGEAERMLARLSEPVNTERRGSHLPTPRPQLVSTAHVHALLATRKR